MGRKRMTRYCLAIDIGASSGRHIVGWLEDGKIQTIVKKPLLGSARISWGGAIFPPNRNVTCWVSSTNPKRKLRKSFTATSTL